MYLFKLITTCLVRSYVFVFHTIIIFPTYYEEIVRVFSVLFSDASLIACSIDSLKHRTASRTSFDGIAITGVPLLLLPVPCDTEPPSSSSSSSVRAFNNCDSFVVDAPGFCCACLLRRIPLSRGVATVSLLLP